MASPTPHSSPQGSEVLAGLAPQLDMTGAAPFAPGFVDEMRMLEITAFGVAVPMFNADGKMLYAEHDVTQNNPTIGWSVPSETQRGSTERIEPVLMTAGRGLGEELGLDPNQLQLRQYGLVAVRLALWDRNGQKILASVLPLYIPPEQEPLIPVQPGTPELSRAEFMTYDKITAIPNHRAGALGFVQQLHTLGLFGPQPIGDEPVVFPESYDDPTMHDLDDAREVERVVQALTISGREA